ncbi:MFS transporter [Actinokineospora bangkokensis]|uniref:MFS transporter n=1 Tax=Actinokineospora bangkokensis TaxID=1193682 RepID=A0A1Q9LKT4_9PSEU|nr:MFS transporter [Actinokineospora bangkokensis]OLR92656.1 MFS transporter [Actinokineospora bangkokensis]
MADARARRARAAVAAVFLTNGSLYANAVPRFPQVKADLGLSNAELGAAVAALPAGSLVGGLFASALIVRLRSGPVAAHGIVALAAAVALVGFAPSGPLFAAALFAAGAVDAVVDVAQNTHGLRVQRVYGRSIVNSFHGLWSIGAVLGGLMGSAAAGLAVPLAVHLTASGALFALVALIAGRFTLRGADTVEKAGAAGEGRWTWPALRLVALLGVLACCGAVTEDAGASWGALFLTQEAAAAPATAGLAFVALQVAMTVGRLLGDRVVDRFGPRRVARAGGLLAAAGMGLALALPSVPTALLGFALAGLGTATVIPAAMHAADEVPGLAAGAGLTGVSWFLRIGFLASSPVVGLVADATSLRVGLLGVVLAGLAVLALGRVLAPSARAGAPPG